MDQIWPALIWRQFGAALDMLEDALRACPDSLWTARLWGDQGQRADLSQFWYIAYHTLFWLDLYLSGSLEGFAPPPPYTLDELDPAGLLPDRCYTRDELLSYLDHGRRKCRAAIAALTGDTARRLCSFPWRQIGYAELILYCMRHVQEHAAQLNMFLGQQTGASARWVARTASDDVTQ